MSWYCVGLTRIITAAESKMTRVISCPGDMWGQLGWWSMSLSPEAWISHVLCLGTQRAISAESTKQEMELPDEWRVGLRAVTRLFPLNPIDPPKVERTHCCKECGMCDVITAIFGNYDPSHSTLALIYSNPAALSFHFHTSGNLIGHRMMFDLFC